MGRVAQKQREKINEALAQLPEEVTGKCSLCNQTLLHVVKSIEAKTGAGTATITRELARVVNAGKPAGDHVTSEQLRARATHLEKGRKKTSHSVPICRNPTDNEKNEDQVPPPTGEEKSKPEPGTVASLLEEIDIQIQDSRDSRPKCFPQHGATPGCDDCDYNLPCKAVPAPTGDPIDEGELEHGMLAELNSDATPAQQPLDTDTAQLSELIALAISGDEVPAVPKTDKQIFQALPRPAEWASLIDRIRKAVIDPQSKLRMNGLSKQMAAFDLALLAKEIGEGGLRAALDDE